MNDKLAAALSAHGISPDLFRASHQDDSIFEGVLPYKGILELWANLVKVSRDSGYYPVIRGDADEALPELDHDPAEILARVPSGSIREVLMPRLHERIDSFEDIADELPDEAKKILLPVLAKEPPDFDSLASAVDRSDINSFGDDTKIQPWPTEPRATSRISLHTLRQSKGKPIRMSMVRVKDSSAEVPAYLGFGGWNDCPDPELQVAALREWRQVYNARPACITGDVLECIIPTPPQTEADAMKLAAEQWIFCDDIVGQGTQSVRNLAIEIWQSKTWFFWWD